MGVPPIQHRPRPGYIFVRCLPLGVLTRTWNRPLAEWMQ